MYSPDGIPLALTVNRDKLSLWDVTTTQLLKTFDGPKSRYLPKRYRTSSFHVVGWPPEQVRSVSYSPNGETIAAVRYNETVQLRNISTGKHIGKPILPLKDDPPDGTTNIVYSPDGKTLATIPVDNRGGTVRLWNTTTGKHLKTLKGYDNCSNSLTFSPDSRTIFTSHRAGTVLLLSLIHI